MKEIHAQFTTILEQFTLDVDIRLPGYGVTALFGHSGSGKTTLLRCIAGLRRAEGRLSVNGESWQDEGVFRPVHKRPIGYVFQEASLFPHLSVEKNQNFGLKRVPRKERQLRFDQVVDWLGLERLLARRSQRLSGGERQRVAIARALLTSPRLLLMDEPLSALDELSKHDILPYLERLHDELAIPVLYVSHSLKEVARLADHMVWLGNGRVRDSGPLQQVLTGMDLAISHGEEASAVLDTTVIEHDDVYHLTTLHSRFGPLRVHRILREIGDEVRVSIPARDISLSLEREEKSSILNIWDALVIDIVDAEPGQVMVKMCCPENAGGEPLLARITRLSMERLALARGSHVYARIKSVGLLE